MGTEVSRQDGLGGRHTSLLKRAAWSLVDGCTIGEPSGVHWGHTREAIIKVTTERKIWSYDLQKEPWDQGRSGQGRYLGPISRCW